MKESTENKVYKKDGCIYRVKRTFAEEGCGLLEQLFSIIDGEN